MHATNSPVYALVREWEHLIDRTWNEYGMHDDPLTVDELRSQIAADLGDQ